MRMRKYAFLYAPKMYTTTRARILNIYVIHKIETYPRYTYPTVTNEDAEPNLAAEIVALSETLNATTLTSSSSSLQTPYRTVSHYGFNYPLTYLPSIALYPTILARLSDEYDANIELQRNLVIEFLKSAALNLNEMKTTGSKDSFISIKEIHLSSPSSCNETETEEDGNFTTIKKFQLMKPTRRHNRWPRTISTCSGTTSSLAYAEEEQIQVEEGETSGLYSLSTHFSEEHEDADCSAGSCVSLPCPLPPTPPPTPPHPQSSTKKKNNSLHSYIIHKSPSRSQSETGVAELQSVRCTKVTVVKANTEDEHNNNETTINKRRDSSIYSASSAATAQVQDTTASSSPRPPPPPQPLLQLLPSEQRIKEERQERGVQTMEDSAGTSVKAQINAIQKALEINIFVHLNTENNWNTVYFKQLSGIIDMELQLISEQLTQNQIPHATSSLSSPSTSTSPTALLTLPYTNTNTTNITQKLNLLEKEMENLLNGILRVNMLTQNLRTACSEMQ